MKMRSLLFIPADSEKKLAKGDGIAADVIILDLEDSVMPDRRKGARELAAQYLAERPRDRSSQLWVRVNPVDTPDCALDLDAVLPGRPDGIVQPKIRGPADVKALAGRLDALETTSGLAAGSTRILPVATETPEAVFEIGHLRQSADRLAALTWGAEDLSAAIGASANKEADGHWTPPYQLTRSLCLFAAAAAGVPAIDTLYADFRDPDGLRSACQLSRRDGFLGKIAIHPAQVDIINDAFTPSEAEIERAQRIISAFDDAPGAGVVSLDGQMLDIPHLKQARKILAMAGSA